MLQEKVAVVTGSSTGIGYETALTLTRNEFYTYATMHKLEGESEQKIANITKSENLPLQVIQLDVNSDKSVIDAINRIVKEKGRIDVTVNNAGYALIGAFEETSMDEITAQFETNFFGAIRVMQAVIPIMRKQRSGRIVNITSMGGRIAIPLDSIYHGTKFALEGLSESIQYELEPFGIKIILIEPGAIGSNFWKNLKMATKISDPNIAVYRQLENNMSEALKQMVQNTIPSSEVSKVILQAITSDNPEFRYIVGKDAASIIEARGNMSDKEFQNLIKKQFNL
jgi:NAD(P)-dependent dehydrogenase (short-subunit alcohol dehydrogenase family)